MNDRTEGSARILHHQRYSTLHCFQRTRPTATPGIKWVHSRQFRIENGGKLRYRFVGQGSKRHACVVREINE